MGTARALAICPDAPSPASFFPPEIFGYVSVGIAGTARADFTAFLRAMGEPSLYCGALEDDTYRLLHLTGSGAPVAVRVARRREGATVTMTTLEAPTWNLPPGQVVESRTSRVPEAGWSALAQAIEKAGFWRSPSHEVPPSTVHDGTPTVVEGRRGTTYHVTDRRSPRRGTPYRDLAVLMLRLANVAEDDLEIGAPGVRVLPYRRHAGAPPPPPPRPR